eukprot:5429853-Pleurochrysis_carterae.AAC.1
MCCSRPSLLPCPGTSCVRTRLPAHSLECERAHRLARSPSCCRAPVVTPCQRCEGCEREGCLKTV